MAGWHGLCMAQKAKCLILLGYLFGGVGDGGLKIVRVVKAGWGGKMGAKALILLGL